MTDSSRTSSSTSSALSIYDEDPSSRGATQAASRDGDGGEDNSAGPSVTARWRSQEGEGSDHQTWPEFLLDGQAGREDDEREPTTGNAAASDGSSVVGRKRRLTGSAEHDAASHERGQSRTRQAQPPSESPSTPAPVRQVSWRSDNSWVPGSSRESAIDVSGSPHSVSRQINSLRHRESSFTDHRLPRWQPDSEVSECPICGTTFSFFYRKHHCRKCGRVVCASCSPHRITIPRQFIVRSPEAQRSLSSIVQPNPSATQVINLIDDDDEYQNRSQPQRYGSLSNPGLGGGEEVRLCNPCVPDPNPEPPRSYGALDSLFRDTGLTWSAESSRGADNRYASYRRNSHRPSASIGSYPFQADAPELRRTGRTGARGEGFPPYGAFDYLPGFHGFPPGYNSSESRGRHRQFSPPAYASSTGSRQPLDYPSSRTFVAGHRTHSHGHNHGAGLSASRTRPLAHPSMGERYQSVNEQDMCPVCNLILPPRAANGNEEAREAHIRSCIERLGGQSHTGSRNGHASPDLPVGMVHFVATEKDCLGREGTAQECSICMEEYEVGCRLTRLECLCKFHKSCIIDWFQRKQECPVHKVA